MDLVLGIIQPYLVIGGIMAYGEKQVNKRLSVKCEFRELTPSDWSKIFSLHFPPSTRATIGLLFAENGKLINCFGLQYCKQHINQVFIKSGLPYRLRGYDIPKENRNQKHSDLINALTEQDHGIKYPHGGWSYPEHLHWMCGHEIRLCVVISSRQT